ncbi:hypothetical protein [Priestia sp. YIM B13489]|uniref:hypothetical protein n=1 Tax=Priestia sp. YIM B13489 TaxID=3366313 RepID=UPI00366E8D6E
MISFYKLKADYGISNKRAKNLIKSGKLTVIKQIENNTYISKGSLEDFLLEQESVLEQHVFYEEILKEFNLMHPGNLYKYIKNYEHLNKHFEQEKDFMKIVQLPALYFNNPSSRITSYFRKRDVEIFRTEYITLVEARKIAKINDGSSFTKWLKRRPSIQIFSFGSLRHQSFIRRDALEEGINKFQRSSTYKSNFPPIEINGYMTQKQAIEKLKVSLTFFREIVAQGILTPTQLNKRNVHYFKEKEVLSLIQRRKKEYEQLSKSHYSKDEVKELFPDVNIDSINHATYVRKILLPSYLTPFYKNKSTGGVGKWLYQKEDIIRYLEEKQRRDSLHNEGTMDAPIDEFRRRLNVLKVSFSESTPITEKLWFEYAFEVLKSNEGNQDYSIMNTIQALTRATELLVKYLKKEIFEYTSNQINLNLMNNNEVSRKARGYIYQYLIFLNKVFLMKNNFAKNIFNFNKIVNPLSLTHSKAHEKKVYTTEEYTSLFSFATNLEEHKNKAIDDVLRFIDSGFKIRNYNRYDSAWLYVLLHLNNAWRHSDCLHIPRISLAGTQIQDLHWLVENDLNDEDVKRIIFRIKAADMLVSKTGKTRNFFCAPKVERALATAIAICELRTQAYNDTSETIIYKVNDGAQMAPKVKKEFFKYFKIKNFDFQNRAMNRTLISLIARIQSETGDNNDSEYIRILRSHINFETTNIYIDIPQERMDEISLQLFDRDMFGHIADVLSNIVFGKTNIEAQQTKNIKNIKDNFGDIYKIEETALFLNSVQEVRNNASQEFLKSNKEYKDIIESIIKKMPHSEAKNLYNKVITGQMPSKKKHYQCIVSEDNCKFPGRDCETCPLSIPHFYALSSLIERIFNKVAQIEKSLLKDLPKAEKVRLANWLALDLQLLKHAQVKYGKQEIAMFATGINEKLKIINPIRQFQTI